MSVGNKFNQLKLSYSQTLRRISKKFDKHSYMCNIDKIICRWGINLTNLS
jgi:hypothetical protein